MTTLKDLGAEWLPLPPQYAQREVLGPHVVPMSREAALEWLRSYDEWVDLWNKHEKDWSLPLSPDWKDGQIVGQYAVKSAVYFYPKRQERYRALIRMKGFSLFPGRTMAFIRGKSKPDQIIWGGWGVHSQKFSIKDFTEPRIANL